MSLTRGERNNNPGNIDRTGDMWQGMSGDQSDPRFIVFTDPQYGIRAPAKILITYQTKYGCNTIRKIINRWAPPNENNTQSYVNAVTAACGVSPDSDYPLNGINLPKVVTAIIEHENGRVSYSPEVIAAGISLAEVSMGTTTTTVTTNGASAPKPGLQSTEFWLTALTNIMAIAGMVTGKMDPSTGAAVMGAINSVYALARNGVKAAHAYGLAQNVPDLPDLPAQGAK